MVTIYDILEVDENATKEEIEKAYNKLVLEYHKSPKNTDKENEENELVLNKLKMGYDILSNDEKRKIYDSNLAKKRAEELIKNVEVKNETPSEEVSNNQVNQANTNNLTSTSHEQVSQGVSQNRNINNNTIVKNNVQQTIQNSSNYEEDDYDDSDAQLTKEEQKKLQKAAQKEFKNNLKKAQKAEEEYNEAYNQAYRSYLRKNGYDVEEPWTIKRIIKLLMATIIVFGVLYLLWLIPPINKALVSIYENNVIIKSTVDIIIMFFDAIFGIFK